MIHCKPTGNPSAAPRVTYCSPRGDPSAALPLSPHRPAAGNERRRPLSRETEGSTSHFSNRGGEKQPQTKGVGGGTGSPHGAGTEQPWLCRSPRNRPCMCPLPGSPGTSPRGGAPGSAGTAGRAGACGRGSSCPSPDALGRRSRGCGNYSARQLPRGIPLRTRGAAARAGAAAGGWVCPGLFRSAGTSLGERGV